MKYLIIAFALTSGLYAQASIANCSQVEKAEYLMAIEKHNVGEYSRKDVAASALTYLSTQLNCKEITKVIYCYEAEQAAKTYLMSIREEVHAGQTDSISLMKASRTLEKIHDYCL